MPVLQRQDLTPCANVRGLEDSFQEKQADRRTQTLLAKVVLLKIPAGRASVDTMPTTGQIGYSLAGAAVHRRASRTVLQIQLGDRVSCVGAETNRYAELSVRR